MFAIVEIWEEFVSCQSRATVNGRPAPVMKGLIGANYTLPSQSETNDARQSDKLSQYLWKLDKINSGTQIFLSEFRFWLEAALFPFLSFQCTAVREPLWNTSTLNVMRRTSVDSSHVNIQSSNFGAGPLILEFPLTYCGYLVIHRTCLMKTEIDCFVKL